MIWHRDGDIRGKRHTWVCCDSYGSRTGKAILIMTLGTRIKGAIGSGGRAPALQAFDMYKLVCAKSTN